MTSRSTMLPAAVVVVLSLALLAAGCGGGGDSTTTVTTSSLSKAQFVKQANKICGQGRNKFLAYLRQQVTLPEAVEASIVPSIEEIADRITELGAPQGDAKQIEAFVVSLRGNAGTLLAERSSVKALSEIEPPFEESAALARKYGINTCVFAF